MTCLARQWVLFCSGLVDFGEIAPFVLRCMILLSKSCSSIFLIYLSFCDNCYRKYIASVFELAMVSGLACASETPAVYSGVRLPPYRLIDFITEF